MSLTAAVLITCVVLLRIYTAYNQESPFETYYSFPTKPPKALLYLSPQEGHYKIGEEFSVNVLVNTMGNNVNAVAAYLSYNKEKLEAISIDISDSVFEIPFEQEITREEGKIKIGLGKPTPGINTYQGKVATIRFKALAKTEKPAEFIYFNFTKGSDLFSGVFLDDKKGTNILEKVRGTKIFID